MSIVTHLIALMVGCSIGIGLTCLLTASSNADDEHKDSWRDR